LAGVERKIDFFAMDLPHSEACFAQAYPAQTAEDSVTGETLRSRSLARCRARSCTTTPSWRWRASSAVGCAIGPADEDKFRAVTAFDLWA
jgi:hypothetical protein